MVCNECGACEACGAEDIIDATSSSYGPENHLEHGFKRFWRPLAAYIYLTICIFDFLGAPLWIEHANQTVNVAAFDQIHLFEDKEVQMTLIENMELGNRSWSPLTLMGGAFFHIAFGAILGVAAFTRGKEKVAAIEKVDPPRARRRSRVSVTVNGDDEPAPKLRDLE